MTRQIALLVCCILLLGHRFAVADEGMWLPNQPPLALLKSRHGFTPSAEWLEHLQKSVVRFGEGGSGSLVSAQGLVMTNHHVGSDMLAALSTAERDLMETGFRARTPDEELPCPGLELNILWSIEDVTDRVATAAKDAPDAASAGAARRRAIAQIEAESQEASGLKSEVVTLFQGARFHLYRYRTYRDVRLVFAPEEEIAFFGGDADNFEFPRYNLDCCFFRIYENGKPLQADRHLKWSEDGCREGDLVFVWGHPGRTQRMYTDAHLRFLRDVELPFRLAGLWRREVKLSTFAGRGGDEARVAAEPLHGVENSRKVYTGLLDGLQAPSTLATKELGDAALRSALEGNPAARGRLDRGEAAVVASLAAARDALPPYELLERGWRHSRLATIARHVVRLANESAKPNAERLEEYGDANRGTLELSLYSAAPIEDLLEMELLAQHLGLLAERMGGDDPLVRALLAGKSPADRARELVTGCTVRDPAVRRSLVDGGPAALAASDDPLLALVAAVDPAARAARQRYEDDVESAHRLAYADIAAAHFAAFGESVYPDATFSLRIAFGLVKGYEEGGVTIGPFTSYRGLFDREELRRGEEAFRLPPRWNGAQGKLNLDVPFNFVCDADITGGNSGSPVVNTRGEVVGLIFDGNIHSLVGDVLFDGTRNRAVAVDSRGMIEAFRSVYGATELVEELVGE